MSTHLIVLAKSPRPGRSKTRLHPPCTLEEAAALAEAALVDTLAAVNGADVDGERVLALDGPPGRWMPHGWRTVRQRGDGLGDRLAAAFADVGSTALLIGMDTPQVTPTLLEDAARSLEAADVDAVIGPAADGGYWAIGLREPDARVFAGVPMSVATTALEQRSRLRSLGLRTRSLAELRDVDTIVDAWAVAGAAPATRFSRALRSLGLDRAASLEGVPA